MSKQEKKETGEEEGEEEEEEEIWPIPEEYEEDEKIIKKYLKQIKQNDSERWYKRTRREVVLYVNWLHDKGMCIDDTSNVVLSDYVTHLRGDREQQDTTIRTTLGSIRSMCRYASRRKQYDTGWSQTSLDKSTDTGLYNLEIDLSRQPAKLAEQDVDDEMNRINYISKEDIQKIYDEAESLRDKVLLKLLEDTGVRVSEACNIKISNITRLGEGDDDNPEKSIKISTSKQSSNEIVPRYVFYTNQFENLLYEWLDGGVRRGFTTAHAPEDGYLLVTQRSAQISKDQISRRVRKLAERAGVQKVRYVDASDKIRRKVTPHTYRHSFAVHRIEMPMTFLQELMGHKNIETTREYQKVLTDDIREAYYDYLP